LVAHVFSGKFSSAPALKASSDLKLLDDGQLIGIILNMDSSDPERQDDIDNTSVRRLRIQSSLVAPTPSSETTSIPVPQNGNAAVNEEWMKRSLPEPYLQTLSRLAQRRYENHYKGGHRITIPTYHLAHIFSLSHFENQLDRLTDDINSNNINTESDVANLRRVLKDYGKFPLVMHSSAYCWK
jgi:hypothetical protein